MEVDLNEIDAGLGQIAPEGTVPKGNDTTSAEDDIAIAEAIHEVEQELQGERKSLIKPENVLSMDLDDIDSNLKQITPSLDDYMVNATGDAATVEDDIAIADAIHEVESELKEKEKGKTRNLFNPTTVVMLVIAGGIVTSRIASMFFSQG